MKYKAGDRVKIKSLDWYNENKNKDGDVWLIATTHSKYNFIEPQSDFCGKVVTIKEVYRNFYSIIDRETDFYWTDEMIEGLVEDENIDCKQCGLIRNSVRCFFMDNCPYNQPKNTIEIPEGWILKDENGNVINATKIVLEKKKKEYPKTYEECSKVLLERASVRNDFGYKADLLVALQKLLVCRDAYWKIAGEEMGLGKPWRPNWNNISDKYCIYFVSGDTWSKECQTRQCPFAFPTPEMRDAFKENFDPDIEICKELLK